jgi:hypothetical protein
MADHDFRVDEVLGATERDEADFDHGKKREKGRGGYMESARFQAGFVPDGKEWCHGN